MFFEPFFSTLQAFVRKGLVFQSSLFVLGKSFEKKVVGKKIKRREAFEKKAHS